MARSWAAALLAIMAGLLFLIATFGYGRDQGIYAVVGRVILEGGMPYRDAFDFKPPGIYLLYALARALFGDGQHGIRALEVAGLAAAVIGLAHLARVWWGEPRIGWLAGGMAALIHAELDFWHTAQPETFGGMLTVGALVVIARKEPSRARYVMCGLLFGLAGALKPPLAGGAVIIALWHRRSWPLLGAIVPCVVIAAWFGARGALGAMYEALFVFTPEYTRLGWQGRTLAGLCGQAFFDWWLGYSSFVCGGVILAAWQWRRRSVGLIAALVAVQLFGVALQGKFFPYHYAGLWPITCLASALGWWELGRAAAARLRHGQLAVVAVMLAVLPLRTACRDMRESFLQRASQRFAFLLDGRSLDDLASVADVNARANREVAEELRRRVPRGGRVYIWGFEPVIYDLADRPCATAFVHNAPQRVGWAADAARAELMRQLRDEPPLAIVVARHDPLPMVTGNLADSAEVLGEFEELAGYLQGSYDEARRIEDFDLYIRSGSSR